MKWISVKDGLPEDLVDVLVYIGNETSSPITVGWYIKKLNEWDGYNCYGDYSIDNVTHWMPLPEVPDGMPV